MDNELREKISALLAAQGKRMLSIKDIEKEPETIVAIAKELGLDLTAEKLREAIQTYRQTEESEPRQLTVDEEERVVGGKPHVGEGIIDFISWIACGFNHHYVYTGNTKVSIDLVFKVTFYEQRCADCGHINWTRTAPPNVQGPKIQNPW